MGNANSSTTPRPSATPNRRTDSNSGTESPSSNHTTHRSLRTKKKSLELPDLASLAFTSTTQNSSPYSNHGRPMHTTTSPIPIPTSPRGNNPESRPRLIHHDLPSMTNISEQLIQPSTHIPFPRPRKPEVSVDFAPPNPRHSRKADLPKVPEMTRVPPAFVSEIVHSTIPVALAKAKEEMLKEAAAGLMTVERQVLLRRVGVVEDTNELVSVKIIWRGGGKAVLLARAGDDDWKGRQVMEREDPRSDQCWSVWVKLAPGTHHFRFLVDETWRIADDLPTAVDDDGALANYVGVALYTPPTIPNTPLRTPNIDSGISFFSASSSTAEGSASTDELRSRIPLRWTSEFPPELQAAAAEEERYLTSSAEPRGAHSVPAPDIPPAPLLPRHLDKLILNVKPPSATAPAERRTRDQREREERRSNTRKSRSQLGMTSTTSGDLNAPVPASGSDSPVESTAAARARLDLPGLADDMSVLPVPSHVVLHHLSTSAIKNGVLAVGNTTRYRKKYLTTIYYKPT